MHTNTYLKSFLFLSFFCGQLPAFCQDTRQLEEVVVTAQKREEKEKEVPFALSVISGKQVQDLRLWDIKDISAIVPNLYSANPGDKRNVTSIRGIATTSYDPAVATYIDGVNQFGLDTYMSKLLDIERIEVLRGPQGTLYGRNAMGGVINIITKQPTNTTSGFAGVDVGTYGQERYSLGLRTPLVPNKLFIGVSGLYSSLSGYYKNTFNNTDFDRQNSVSGSYYLKFLPGESWALTLNVKHDNNRNSGTFPLASGLQQALDNPYSIDQNAVSRMHDNVFNASFSANRHRSNVDFASQTAYQSNYRYYPSPLDADFSPIDGATIVNNYGRDWNNVKAATQEFRLSSSAAKASALSWLGGLYSFYQDNPVKQGTHFGKDAAYLGSPISNFTSINTNKGENYGLAFFGQGTYAVTSKFSATLGLRYDYEHKKETVKGEFQPDGSGAITTQDEVSANAHFTALSPKVSLAYKFTENQNAYAIYSRGFRAGGISPLSSDPSQPPLFVYDPEHSSNFELGLKSSLFQELLQLNLAAFYTRVNDAQVPTLMLPDAVTVVKNAGKLNSKGFEAGLKAIPAKGLNLQYNFGLTDAKYKSLALSSGGSNITLNGNKQIFTPSLTLFLAVQYETAFKQGSETRAFLHGDWKYVGEQYFDLANNIKQKGYNLLSARAGVALQRFNVSVWASNILNKRFIDYAYDFGAVHLGEPRTYGVSLMTTINKSK